MPPPKSNSCKGIVRNGRTNAKAELQVRGDWPTRAAGSTFPLIAPGITNRLMGKCRTGRMSDVTPRKA